MPIPASEEKQLEWKNLIEQQRQSTLSVKKWCQQNQIRHSTFQYWKEKLCPKHLHKNSFAELNTKHRNTISLEAQGLYVRMDSDCDSHLRKQLFAIFAALSC